MVILQTEPIPLFVVLFFAVLIILILFLVKILFSDRLLRKALRPSPLILVLGPPRSGKKRIMENLFNTKTKTKTYPFVGRFRICDLHIKNKTFRSVCFHSMKNNYKLSKDNIKLQKNTPNLILFIMKVMPDIENMRKQGEIVNEIKKLYPKTPLIAIMNKTGKKGKANYNSLRKIFKSDLAKYPVDTDKGIERARSLIERKLMKY